MSRPHVPSSSANRVASLAAVVFAVSFFGTVATINVPHSASDARLLDWWQQDSSLTAGLVSMSFAILTAVCFAVVANNLFVTIGERSPHLVAFARSMAAAFTGTLLVSGALRGVIHHLVKVENEPLPSLDVLRYTTNLGYTLTGVVVMGTFAMYVLSLAVVVLRTGVVGRWMGFAGLGCGVITIGAVVAMVGSFSVPVAILWALCTSVALWRLPAAAPAPAGERTVSAAGR